ncbi:hypothetical protein LIER_05394 [Lithospermum erythrorhizon]|uniref:G-patch domain-containing protein n=1 Tax=Lithospermum erythrorhizon TaxID=34254 RepID=A0AAV3P1M3_LITER
MEGSKEGDSEEHDITNTTFIWDKNSQLYYHNSSGFYHDPIAGWYYSSKDGFYYKFENGNYVLLESNYVGDCEKNSSDAIVQEDSQFNVQHDNIVEDGNQEVGIISSGIGADDSVFVDNQMPQNVPPPSEWLEDTLIELYLAGYPNRSVNSPCGDNSLAQADDLQHMYSEIDGENDILVSDNGERQSDDKHDSADQGESASIEDEERWRAQYGQATDPKEESSTSRLVDLWDWTTVDENRKHGKGQVTRLVGRLAKRSAKLHPSVPSSGGGLFRTAPVCKVHLDLVQVTSGQTYRLRTPSTKYLASASSFDSSNPTNGWSFPSLSNSEYSHHFHDVSGKCESECSGQYTSAEQLLESERGSIYRDRAAERRALHGSFGVGPGQKKSSHDLDSASSPNFDPGEAAAEALRFSFGEGNYGKKILERMGWKEGEALGSSRKGLNEPLQAIGNKGLAGIGWDENSRYSSSNTY